MLACDNGTLDLRTGKLRPHRREDLITSRSSVAYVADAPCPRWQRFLAEVFEPNPDAAVFVQRFAGYSLTSDTSAQCLLFAHGGGANGKGVFFHIIAKLLGGLATTVPFDTFVHRRNGEIPGHTLASMFGKRVVMAPEGNKGDRLAEGLIKQVTGGDAITARFMYKDPFNYQPAFKLWMSSNHEPEIRGNDDGIWRRFKLVPFEVSFEGRRDDHLEDALDAELPGILAWAVRGCLDWQRDGGGLRGLGQSASVTEATVAYRSESDTIGRFLAECCVTHVQDAKTKTTAVYDAYRSWAERTGCRPMNNVWFGRELRQRGFHPIKDSYARFYPLGLIARQGAE